MFGVALHPIRFIRLPQNAKRIGVLGAWLDEENDRIVNISLWESKEDAMKATAEMHPMFSDSPWIEWERKPAENISGLSRVV